MLGAIWRHRQSVHIHTTKLIRVADSCCFPSKETCTGYSAGQSMCAPRQWLFYDAVLQLCLQGIRWQDIGPVLCLNTNHYIK